MSKGPSGIGSKEFIGIRKINIKLSKEDWCMYEGKCKEELNIKTLCWNCIWMNRFDIPALVEEELKNGINNKLE